MKNENFLETLDAKCSNDVNAHIEQLVQDLDDCFQLCIYIFQH